MQLRAWKEMWIDVMQLRDKYMKTIDALKDAKRLLGNVERECAEREDPIRRAFLALRREFSRGTASLRWV